MILCQSLSMTHWLLLPARMLQPRPKGFPNPLFTYLGRGSMSKLSLTWLLLLTLFYHVSNLRYTNALLPRLVARPKYRHLHCWH